MAKKNDVVPQDSGGSDSILGTLKGVLAICAVAGLGIYMSYSAGTEVSNKVLRQVRKERRKHERDKRRDQKEKKREERRKQRLEMIETWRKRH